MGSGCFSPNQVTGQIDIEILDAIYLDIKNIDISSHASSYSIQESSQEYKKIKQNIVKRGLVKKLCDYLSAHRFRICDNLVHNLRIVTQTKIAAYKYTALIILEQIFKMLPDNTQSIILCQSLKTIQSYRDDKNNRSQANNKNNVSKLSYSVNKFESQVFASEYNSSISSIIHQITSPKFQATYLNLIGYLLSQNEDIYLLTLKNLIHYCQLSNNAFNNEQTVLSVIKIITSHIQIQQNVLQSLKALQSMVKRVKKSFFIQNFSILQKIIETKNDCAFDQQNSKSHNEDISNSCFQICLGYLNNCFQTKYYLMVFHKFLGIMDQRQFKDVQSIEDFMFNLISEHQLRDQLIKHLLIQFFAYTAYPQDNNMRKYWKTLYSQEHYTQFITKFPNILHLQTKVRCLEKIKKWLSYQAIINLDNMFAYNGNNLVCAYTLNLCSKFQQVKNISVNQIINLTNNLIKNHRFLLLRNLVNLTREKRFQDDQNFTILAICVRVLSKQQKIQIPDHIQDMFSVISSDNHQQINSKLMQLVSLLLSKMNQSVIRSVLSHICKFLLSIHDAIVAQEYSLKQKMYIAEKYQEIIGLLPRMHYQGIIISFSQKLAQTCVPSLECRWLIDYLIETNMCFLHNNNKFGSIKQSFQFLRECNIDECNKFIENYHKTRVQCIVKFDSDGDFFLREQSGLYFKSSEQMDIEDMRLTMSGFGKLNSVLSVQSCRKQDNNLQSVINILRK